MSARARVKAWEWALASGLWLWVSFHWLLAFLSVGADGRWPMEPSGSLELGVGGRGELWGRFVLRLALLGGVGLLAWRWYRRRWHLQSGLRPGVRAAFLGSMSFGVLHVLHVVLANAREGFDSVELSNYLAATFSATYLGVPWLALAYLLGAISTTAFVALELWLLLGARGRLGNWRSRRNWQLLLWGGGAVSFIGQLRLIIFYAAGDDLFRLLPSAFGS